MSIFLFIRHGTHGLLGKRFVARTAGVLINEQGWREAVSVSKRLEGVEIEAIYSSPLERAMQTADPLSKRTGLEVQVREELNEIDVGEWSNLEFETLRSKPGWEQWRDVRSCFHPPGGELMLDTQARMVRLVEELRRKHSGVVALFSHGDPIKGALAHYLGTPLDLFRRIDVDPGSISAVQITDEGPNILRLNDTGDLRL